MSDLENQIQAKGLTAPRITPGDIEANIAKEFYFTAGDGVFGKEIQACGSAVTNEQSLNLLTFCVLVLKNGFTVVGKSGVASPENFNFEIGCKIARENAVREIWPLMGYELRTKLAENEKLEKFKVDAKEIAARLKRVHLGDKESAFTDDELTYAASSRCECGAGMAYPSKTSPAGSWECSDILTLRALGRDKTHTAALPFMFYEIKSEGQPSAYGATTRPGKDESCA